MIFFYLLSALLYALQIAAQCDPTKATCKPIAGLATSEYSIDFAKSVGNPPNWTLADQAVVKYGGANGAEFTFAKRGDAPYIWTSFYFLFGRVEVTMQAAPGQGIVTGAVLMSDNHDEIDWEWSGSNFNSKDGKVQTNYFGKGVTGNYDRGTQPAVDAPTAKFHKYVIDWTPDSITWSIDGNVVRTQKSSGATDGAYQHPQTPSRFHLGLWNAGDKDSNAGVVKWAGGYTDMNKVPYTALIKDVKITTPNPCSSWEFPTGFTGKWQDVKCTNKTLERNLPCTYNVTSGDHGYLIADKLGLRIQEIKDVNAGVDWDKLMIGQTLRVPGGNCTDGPGTKPSPVNPDSPFKSNGSNQVLNETASSTNSAPFQNTTAPYQNTTTASYGNSSTPTTASATTTSSAPLVQYTCAKGDYGQAIATKLNCTFEELQKANPNCNWDKLNVGQVLNSCKQANTTGTSTVATSTTTATNTIYEVKKGDYCEKILVVLQCNQEQFTMANPGLNCDSLTISQPVTVPTAAPSCSVCKTTTATSTVTKTSTNTHTVTGQVQPVPTNGTNCLTYTVGKGDYGVKIAESFGLTFAELEKANAGINWDKLWIGSTLKVPGTPSKKPSTGVNSSACSSTTPGSSSSTVKPGSTSSSAPRTTASPPSTTASPTPSSTMAPTPVTMSSGTPMTTTVTQTCPTCAWTTITVPCTPCMSQNSTQIVTTSSSATVNTTVTPTTTSTTAVLPNSNNSSSTTSAPPSTTSSPCLYYTVASNDYGVGIANSFGHNFEKLKEANPGCDWLNLKIDQKLMIPAGWTEQPAKGVAPAAECKALTVSTSSSSSSSSLTQSTSGSTTSPSTSSSSSAGTTNTSTTSSSTMPPSTSSSSSSTSSGSSLSTTSSSSSQSTTTMTSTTSSPSSTPITTISTTSMPPNCHADNCLRGMLDVRNAPSATSFCKDYVKTSNMVIPTWIPGCEGKPHRVTSACSCFSGSTPPPPPSTTFKSSSSSTSSTMTTTSSTSSNSSSSTTSTPPSTTPTSSSSSSSSTTSTASTTSSTSSSSSTPSTTSTSSSSFSSSTASTTPSTTSSSSSKTTTTSTTTSTTSTSSSSSSSKTSSTTVTTTTTTSTKTTTTTTTTTASKPPPGQPPKEDCDEFGNPRHPAGGDPGYGNQHANQGGGQWGAGGGPQVQHSTNNQQGGGGGGRGPRKRDIVGDFDEDVDEDGDSYDFGYAPQDDDEMIEKREPQKGGRGGGGGGAGAAGGEGGKGGMGGGKGGGGEGGQGMGGGKGRGGEGGKGMGGEKGGGGEGGKGMGGGQGGGRGGGSKGSDGGGGAGMGGGEGKGHGGKGGGAGGSQKPGGDGAGRQGGSAPGGSSGDASGGGSGPAGGMGGKQGPEGGDASAAGQGAGQGRGQGQGQGQGQGSGSGAGSGSPAGSDGSGSADAGSGMKKRWYGHRPSGDNRPSNADAATGGNQGSQPQGQPAPNAAGQNTIVPTSALAEAQAYASSMIASGPQGTAAAVAGSANANSNKPAAGSGNVNANANTNVNVKATPVKSSTPSVNANANSNAKPSSTGKTGSGNSRDDPVSGKLPPGGSAGGAPQGQSNLYVDGNNVPPEMASAAAIAGFASPSDYAYSKRSMDDDDDEEEVDPATIEPSPIQAQEPPSTELAQDDEDDVEESVRLNAPVAALDDDDDDERDADYDLDRRTEPSPTNVSSNQHGKARDEKSSKEGTRNRQPVHKPGKEGGMAGGTTGEGKSGSKDGSWKRQVDERLMRRNERRAMGHE